MKYEKIVNQFRDERSMELYGKPESQLTIAEVQKLNEYIKDFNNPIWKPVYIDGVKTEYMVSNTGDVIDKNKKSVKRYQEYKDWYYQVYISGKGIEAFID